MPVDEGEPFCNLAACDRLRLLTVFGVEEPRAVHLVQTNAAGPHIAGTLNNLANDRPDMTFF